MNKTLLYSFFMGILLGGCQSPQQKNGDNFSSLDPNAAFNSKELYLEGDSFLPTLALFFPNGALLDIRAGAMPFYYYSDQTNDGPVKIYARNPTTILNFETGTRKLIKNAVNKSMIKRVTYGSYSKDDLQAFLQTLNNNDYVINIEVKGSEEGKGQNEQTSSNSPPDSTKTNNTSKTTLDTTSVDPNIDPAKKVSIPYMLIAYNKKKNSEFEIVTPSNILNFKKQKYTDDFEFFLAAYPSIYFLNPGEDLRIYSKYLGQKVSETKLNADADCPGFTRNNSSTSNVQVLARKGNCPYLKFWQVNYLISARAVVYLNKSAILNDLTTNLQIPDNSLSEINKLLWNVGKGETVKVNIKKQQGILSNSSMQYFERKVQRIPLSWNCNENSTMECIPAGPSNVIEGNLSQQAKGSNQNDTLSSEIDAEIPIYAILNFNAGDMANMIKEAPKYQLNLEMINEP